MKKLLFILYTFISIFIFASCKDENSFMSVDDEPCYSILVSAPDNSTRATYMEDGEDIAVVWEKGDVIYVGDYEFVFKEMQGDDALFFHYGDIANAASWTGTVSFGSTVDLTSQFQKKNNTCGEHLVANVTNINLNNKPRISLLPADNMSLLHVRVKAPVMLLGSSMMKVEGLDKSDVYTVTLGDDPTHVFADKDEPMDVYVAVQADKVISGTLKFNFYVYDESLKNAELGDEYHFYVRCNNVITPVNNEVLKVVLPSKPTHVALQMGLSVKWSPVNIGATDRAETGTYFAWGEIEPAPGGDYSEGNCKAYNKKWDALYKNGYVDKGNADGILVPKYDAATQNWGDDWKMPTRAEFQELMDNCSYEMVKPGDYYGYEFTSKINNKKIFFANGGQWEGKVDKTTVEAWKDYSGKHVTDYCRGQYWVSNVAIQDDAVRGCAFTSVVSNSDGHIPNKPKGFWDEPNFQDQNRSYGRLVRPVRKSN